MAEGKGNKILESIEAVGWGALILDLGKKVFHRFMEKSQEHITTAVKEKITKDERPQVLNFIRVDLGDPASTVTLWRRYKESRNTPGGEARFESLCEKAYKALVVYDITDPANKKEDDTKTLERRKKFFIELANMDDNDFKEALYFLEHDVIQQWFARIKDIVGKTKPQLATADKKAAEEIRKVTKFLEQLGIHA